MQRDLGINSRTAIRWWKHHQETGKLAYKKLQRNPGRPNSLTPEHEQHIQQIFEDLKISKSQMNHYLRNNMLISIKNPTFDPMTRNTDNSLQTRYEWFMKWKGSDLSYTNNCVFIGGKEQRACDIIIEKPSIEYIDVEESTAIENNRPVAKGTTTANFIRFINDLLDIMDMDENLMGRYLVMDYCTAHKSHPMIRKNDSRGYRVMYLPPYSPELNPIEQF
ncbi:hypothetical protein G6F57_007332 [Rhizopus arrhizus]|uniref:Tc1-like transposase DDE domain-containing protein n=1 Tax=Rhizopus oryzae TaxID=64495 RepID=A0A9P7BMR4_RHIOR|nr:hypothetical protein G6F23_008473 [Rhizopus arrhizus]KAG1396273.1 hypothetical protein G6F58_011780 [Rhizopus delemar]KAG0762241.1 hypothetical protein G6F24_006948 [Rhizopus arrhizus]KAG0780197.1 hypothetical protein G6F22_010216 [Rhizopus arrhizus]KAG0790307.1 hypothetical protein G6F21_005907 [Rhizopus arrhizus]